MNIDGENAVLGRLASYVAKKALLGETINILNCEKIIVSGNRKFVIKDYVERKTEMGTPKKGPFMYNTPEKFVKRTIRGMLPHKQEKGREALKRIMCYRGIPSEFEGKPIEKVAQSKLNINFVTVSEICKALGGKI